MIDWLDRQLSRAAVLVAIIGAAGIVALMMVTLVAVFWRYVVKDPIFGISDISVLTLSVVAAASVAFGARHNAHVSVDVIRYFFGTRVRRVVDVFMRILSIAILLLASWALVDKACGFEKACVTDNLSIEHRPFFYILSVAMLFYALHMFVQLGRGLRRSPREHKTTEPND